MSKTGSPRGRGGRRIIERARRAPTLPPGRRADVVRRTTETEIELSLGVDGRGRYEIETGIPFLNHMLELFARHGFFDLRIRARGDIEVGQSPSGRALKFVHRGSYDSMDSTYEAITNHLDEKRLEAQDTFVEEYETDPVTTAEDKLVVNVYVPVK